MKHHRPLSQIAMEIKMAWKSPYHGALPYMKAMRQLKKLGDKYGADDADDIVLRFLINAGTWKGEVARKTKRELNSMLRDFQKSKVDA